jgi:hypothetical protein
MLSRGDLFSARSGLGVQMLQRVYSNPSCDGEHMQAACLQTSHKNSRQCCACVSWLARQRRKQRQL